MTTNAISWWRTEFGVEEARRVAQSIEAENISQGPVTEEFERSLANYLGVRHVVATTSGSVAELLSLLAIGIQPGDEVIVPNRTWISTAHAPVILGAKAVLVDVERDRPLIDPAQIESHITPRTKAIIPVHLNGRAADLDLIHSVAAAHGLRVIEDAAQAFGSRNVHGLLGTQSDAGFFSLSVAKIIATGQGGFVATNDTELYARMRLIRTHGVADVVNAAWTQLGFNFRFTDILSSIGIEQLRRLPGRIDRLKEIYRLYAASMPHLPFLRWLPVDIDSGEIPLYVEVLCKERDRLVSHLASHGIQARPFYPDLDHASYLQAAGDFPNSRKFGRDGLFLPSGPAQPLENIERVINVLKLFSAEDYGHG